MNSASVCARKVFADAGRAEEDERADRAARILEIGARAAQRLADGDDRFVLADDLALELAFHREQLLRSPACSMRWSGTPVHFETTCMMSSSVTMTSLLFALLTRHSRENRVELLLRLLLAVAQGGGLLEVLRLDRASFRRGSSSISASMSFTSGGRVIAPMRAREPGFVHHVDGLVRQEAAGEIAVGELDGGFERLVRELALWCSSYFGRRPLRIRIVSSTVGASTFTVWKRRSSAASFSMYLRYSLSVVAPTHCSSPRQSAGLMMLRRVHRAFGRAGADDGVQLVDEEDDVLGAADFVHHGLDALLELAAILRARDHQREVERDDFLVAQESPARCRWRFPARGLRRWRSCRRRLRR